MDADVVVVGAGPVGLMLAVELRLGGAEVTVLERLAEPSTESRASTLHARTMEVLDQRGMLESLGTPPNDGLGHFGGVALDLSGLPTRYPGQWKVPQTRVVELLAERAGGLGADVRRGHEVRGLAVLEDRVQVQVAGPGGMAEITGRYLVGCDGENSAVRRLAAFDFPGTDATRELLCADVARIEVPNRRFERFAGGLAIAARRPDGVTRVMVHEFGRPAGLRTGKPRFAEVVQAWARVVGEDIGGGTPLWVNSFGDASRQVTRYREGRVMVAGDAAHRQMPVGGQALNLGLQDAANLGWKLAAAVRGWAPPGLLDSYHDERHQVGARVLANIQAQAALLLGGREVDAVRTVLGELIGYPAARTHLGAMITGLDIRYGHDDQPLVGARMPHLELDTGSGTTSAAALLRAARGVLLDLSADRARKTWLDAATSRWADRVDLVSATALPGSAAEGLATVLLRPDGHVAWVGDRLSDPRPTLSHWFGAGAGAPAAVRHVHETKDTLFPGERVQS